MTAPRRSATVVLERSAASLEQVRTWLQRELWTDGTEAVADIVLMADELVANVLLHTSSTPIVTLSFTGRGVRIGVHDSDRHLPLLRPVDRDRIGGLGLRIVDQYAYRWGTEYEGEDGKCVWFEVELDADGRPERRQPSG